ncbi:unnamed protein product, partial [Brenthis ino]
MCDVIELDGEEVANENVETEYVDVTEETNHLSSSIEQESTVSKAKTDSNVNCDKPRDAQNIDSSTISKANELDKFKRRLIRVIARSLLVEKKPEEEIWKELKKETACDCKLLWTRMRAVTVKKLRRLFVAEDKLDNITKIAQLSITDWLLFDLVLVHEKVDVIGQEEPDINKNQKDAKILEELFQLVVKHKIEYLESDALTRAWYDLTQEYNRCGRKCSPMLLQRRWFQLKELVWYNFYNFWFSYHGDARRLKEASHYKPTSLQREIIKCFNKIVTQQFPSWEQLIKEKKVSLPADFERLQLSKKKRKFTENEPDLVVIEPHVETIDLRLESDSESKHEDSNNESDSNEPDEKAIKSQLNLTIVKTETINDVSDENDISLLESVHIPLESLESTVTRQDQSSINDNVNISNDVRDTVTHTIDDEARGNSESNQSNEFFSTDEGDDMQNEDLCEKSKDLIENIEHSHNNDEHLENVDKIYDNDDLVISDDAYSNSKKLKEFNKKETEQLGIRKLVRPTITHNAVENKITIDDDTPDEINDILEGVVERITKNKLHRDSAGDTITLDVAKANLLSNIKEESTFLENNGGVKTENGVLNDAISIDGLELEDDGIEYVEDEEDMTVRVIKTKIPEENEESDMEDHKRDNAPKIDLKLLLNPVVYTKRLDDMDVFRFIDYESVKDGRIIKNAMLESSPVDKKSINMEDISEECQKACENDSSSDESLNSYDCQHRISSKSWYFQKPKIVSYNPIQLCKNPDFNTRLKRLTAGFFSSERNRRLLQECKPITIDVHKSFEIKLSSNSLLVEEFPFKETDQRESIKTLDETVIPSLPVKTFGETRIPSPVSFNSSNNTENILPNTENVLPNTELLKNLLPKTTISNRSHTVEPSIERNKVINLPDINQIRRANEKLLIAEVTPIQCKGDKKAPVEIIQKKVNNTDDNSVSINNKPEISQPDLVKLNDNTNALNKLLNNGEVSDAPKSQPVLEENTNKNETPGKLGVQIQEKRGGKEKGFKLKKIIKKKVAPPPPPPTAITPQPKIPEFVRKGTPTDRLLAMDTVERILSVCQGEIIPKKKKNNKKKTSEKEKDEVAKSEGQSASEKPIIIKDVTDVLVEQCIKNTTSGVAPHKDESEKQDNQPQLKKTIRIVRKRNGYCCWASRQMKCLKVKGLRSRPHTCPKSKCTCCCQKEYKNTLQRKKREKYYSKIDDLIDLDSDGEKDAHQNTKLAMVTKEINTDYDPELRLNLLKARKTCHKINENIETSNKCNSINKSKNNEPQTSVLTKEITHPEDSFTEGLNPIITNVQSLSQPLTRTLPPQDKNNTNKMKCKTNVVFSPGPAYLTSPNKSTKPIPETLKNVKLLTPDNKVYVMNDKSKDTIPQSPISLGKNKILLCSVKPIEEVDSSIEDQIVLPQITNHNLLPPGVHLTLMPNNELALSIDSGVELDTTQLANLPAIIASVQQEFNSAQGNSVIEDLTNNYSNTAVEADNLVTLLNEESFNVKPSDENPNLDNINVSVETSDAGDNMKIDVFGTLDGSDLVASVVECVTESRESIEEVKNAEVNENVISIDDSTSVLEVQNVISIDDSTSVLEVQSDSKQLINNDKPTNLNKKNEHNVVSKTIQDSAKKTILSDLMEMSGISVEDTSIASMEKNSVRDNTETEIMETQPLLAPKVKDLLSIKPDSVINNVLTNTVSNKSVDKAICPELNIITSFQELKYAYENNGQFYKMDIDTGKIIPINVQIKKKLVPKLKRSSKILPEMVIDLTDDSEKEEQAITMNNPEQPKITIEPPKAVKPVRLIKAIHPAILKRSGKSILIKHNEGEPNAKYKKKNVIHFIKRKRKQDIEINNVESPGEVANEKEIANISETVQIIPHSGSESDDEPLAFKAKRRKGNDQIEAIEELEDNAQEEKPCGDQITVDNPSKDDVNTEEPIEHSMNTILEPVAFNDSSDEDCILGV